jgi:hypothetical protein
MTWFLTCDEIKNQVLCEGYCAIRFFFSPKEWFTAQGLQRAARPASARDRSGGALAPYQARTSGRRYVTADSPTRSKRSAARGAP